MFKDAHATKIADERAIMDRTGWTRGQTREFLGSQSKPQSVDDSLSDKPSDRASELLMKFAQRETVAKAPVVATQHEVTPASVVQTFEPRPFTLQAGGEGQAGATGGGGGGGKEVLILNNTDLISSIPTEISTAVTWPDATACVVDMGDQDPSIIFGGYWVEGGILYLRWVCYGSGQPLSGNDITITAFL